MSTKAHNRFFFLQSEVVHKSTLTNEKKTWITSRNLYLKSNFGNSSRFCPPKRFFICSSSFAVFSSISGVQSTNFPPWPLLFCLYDSNFSRNNRWIGSAFLSALANITDVMPMFLWQVIIKHPVARLSNRDARSNADISCPCCCYTLAMKWTVPQESQTKWLPVDCPPQSRTQTLRYLRRMRRNQSFGHARKTPKGLSKRLFVNISSPVQKANRREQSHNDGGAGKRGKHWLS